MEVDDRIVDACAMQRVLNPRQLGDILSDEIGGLVGEPPGIASGATIGTDAAILEAVHGSAPDIAGKGIANPLAVLRAVALVLDHVGRASLAQRLHTAIDRVLCTGPCAKTGCAPANYGRKCVGPTFAQAILHRLTV